MNNIDSIAAISQYRESKNILNKDGQFFKTKATVFNKNNICIYCDIIEYSFSYNAGYGQYNINILWNMEEISSTALGLFQTYNTKFQSVSFENDSLIIADNKIRIILE